MEILWCGDEYRTHWHRKVLKNGPPPSTWNSGQARLFLNILQEKCLEGSWSPVSLNEWSVIKHLLQQVPVQLFNDDIYLGFLLLISPQLWIIVISPLKSNTPWRLQDVKKQKNISLQVINPTKRVNFFTHTLIENVHWEQCCFEVSAFYIYSTFI